MPRTGVMRRLLALALCTAAGMPSCAAAGMPFAEHGLAAEAKPQDIVEVERKTLEKCGDTAAGAREAQAEAAAAQRVTALAAERLARLDGGERPATPPRHKLFEVGQLIVSVPVTWSNVLSMSLLLLLAVIGCIAVWAWLTRKSCRCKLCKAEYVALEPLGKGGFGRLYVVQRTAAAPIDELDMYSHGASTGNTKTSGGSNSVRAGFAGGGISSLRKYVNDWAGWGGGLRWKNRNGGSDGSGSGRGTSGGGGGGGGGDGSGSGSGSGNIHGTDGSGVANSQKLVLKMVQLDDLTQLDVSQIEAKQLRSLRHPHIVRYVDDFVHTAWGRVGEQIHVCIVMEWCPKDMRTAIAERDYDNPFSEEVVVRWLTQICMALNYCHHKGVFHRDVKTQNVFLTESGDIRLGDFGLCRPAPGLMSYSDGGTDTYMPPEVLLGKKLDGKKVDVWCVGLLLYELMSLAFVCEHVGLLGAQVVKDASAVNNLLGTIPGKHGYSSELRKMAQRLLAVEPDERPSMDSLLKRKMLRRYTQRGSSGASQRSGGGNRARGNSSGTGGGSGSPGTPADDKQRGRRQRKRQRWQQRGGGSGSGTEGKQMG